MTEQPVLTEDEALEVLALLITSARIQRDEQAHYGPLRLLTAVQKLGDFIKDRVSPETQQFLNNALAEIPDMHMRMAEDDFYVGKLDMLCRAIAQRLVERSGIGGSKHE